MRAIGRLFGDGQERDGYGNGEYARTEGASVAEAG